MPLIELVRGLSTNDTTVQRVVELSKLLGKIVGFAKDTPGFLVNRLFMPYINEAVYALSEVFLVSS